jgi:hypothetical protein
MVADSFVGRWSRRKQEARTGAPQQEAVPVPGAVPSAATATKSSSADALNASLPQQNLPVAQQQEAPAIPLPTLEDVKALTADSDFKPFVARGVDEEVRNAAMKKLFADPHYNVMDRLDTYIDDYSLPDPIPVSMMRQLASAKFLNLFDEDEDKEKSETAPEAPVKLASQASTELTQPPELTPPDHDHTDLRLQQDDAAGAQGSGGGAG